MILPSIDEFFIVYSTLHTLISLHACVVLSLHAECLHNVSTNIIRNNLFHLFLFLGMAKHFLMIICFICCYLCTLIDMTAPHFPWVRNYIFYIVRSHRSYIEKYYKICAENLSTKKKKYFAFKLLFCRLSYIIFFLKNFDV